MIELMCFVKNAFTKNNYNFDNFSISFLGCIWYAGIKNENEYFVYISIHFLI